MHGNKVYWTRNVVVVQKIQMKGTKSANERLLAIHCLYSSAHSMLSLIFKAYMIVDKLLEFIS